MSSLHSIKKRMFISLEKCFCEFVEIIVDYTCALADQSLYAGIVYERYCLCPGWPLSCLFIYMSIY
jgi:hypothetical protein